MTIVIETEGSLQFGHGHIMRSVYLARAARRKGLNVHFLARTSYTADVLAGLGESVCQALPAADGGPCLMVVDAPTITTADAVHDMQKRGMFVVLMDVLTDARAEADMVCDAMMTPRRAESLLHSAKTQYLYGLRYACLDEQFRLLHGVALPSGGEARLLVAFGGSDVLQSNNRYLAAMARQGFLGPAEIVVGMNGAEMDEVRALVATWRDTHVVCNVGDMALRMAEADLVVTKLGMTQLEAFCVGRMCVVVEPTQAHVDLQRELEAVYNDWPVIECGLVADTAFEQAAKVTMRYLSDRNQLAAGGSIASRLVDGQGAERIIDAALRALNRPTE